MMSAPLFGVDYYPEHWDRARWSIDARLMQQAGITTVRLAEFAWSRLEPREGCFDFAWLDEAMDILMAHDIQVILGTPTAAPPGWPGLASPEILPVNEDGQQAGLEFTLDGSAHLTSIDTWVDELAIDDAEVLARYRGGPFDGAPAITLKQSGTGKVFYAGTSLPVAGLEVLMSKVLMEAGLPSGIPSPENVEIIRREHDGHDWWFLLNHNATPRELELPVSGVDVFTDRSLAGKITLHGFEVLVIEAIDSSHGG